MVPLAVMLFSSCEQGCIVIFFSNFLGLMAKVRAMALVFLRFGVL